MSEEKLSGVEKTKLESNYLRGNIASELADANDFVSDESYELLKFHGSYQGYNRDTATIRKKTGLDKEWEFMLRLKMPGGRLSAEQYLALDKLCAIHANATLRITTRQTFQFHCIVKSQLKPFIAEINRILLTTLGGCGDVVRNVITCPAPIKDNIHHILEKECFSIAKEFAPKTDGYWDIWLDGEKIDAYPFLPSPSSSDKIEPLYGETYMPRKFKIALGQPEDNCMDALCNDLALLALFDGQELKGYNVAIGGGLGMTHNNEKTYPLLAQSIGFIKPQDLLKATEAVIALQRDNGDRGNRKHARLKYVVKEQGLAWCKSEIDKYFGREMAAPLEIKKWAIDDHVGWHEQGDGKWFLGVPIPSGRIADDIYNVNYRTALSEVISTYKMPIILTNDQNIILCDIEAGEKIAIANILRKYNLRLREDISDLARNFFACVSLPTCGKALAEAERVQNPLENSLQKLLDKYEIGQDKISVRLAGCPNGCSRPYVGDIGIVGRTPENYAIFIGGDFEGTRLNEKIFDKVPFENIDTALEPFVSIYKESRTEGEGLGDFCHRYGIEKIKKQAVEQLSNYKWAA
ncbi:MAG: NADPH-dependent assimilatory sulfite reductase hemoprotein subunit [Pseudomonadota bacterium]